MDAFYASVEQRDDPSLRGRPVVVGGSPESRGVVAAASYEARAFGIRSAMPAARAGRLCPEAVFLRPRFDHYRAVSRHIQDIFRRWTPLVEPLSLDEAYLDVTEVDACHGSATWMAQAIRQTIREETDLAASAGVSYNKMLAKLASDEDKPDGLYTIAPGDALAYLARQPVGRLHGVGPATRAVLEQAGFHTVGDLQQYTPTQLFERIGHRAAGLADAARGLDDRPVRPHRDRKSIGAENTFPEDVTDLHQVHALLEPLAERVGQRLVDQEITARTVTLKVRYNDFELNTRSVSPRWAARDRADVLACVPELLARTEVGARPVRLLGLSVSGLATPPRDDDLFAVHENAEPRA